jgi:NAD(P)-dependent dehydrogenase (short-subunit alcohol dehydrogenase family)
MSKPLHGRNAIITGANQGFGLALAHAYVNAGASIMMCARDGALLEAARAQVAAQATDGQQVVALATDVSDRGQVEALVNATLQSFPQVHVLINNAGVYGPLGSITEVDWEEWVAAININLLGSILMCRALLPHFKSQRYGKIVQLSGGGATNPLPRISAYAASKAAIVRFAETLAHEVQDDRIDVNSIAPGALNTRLLDQVLASGPERVGDTFYAKSLAQKESGGASLERGTSLAVFLGSPASDGITGRLLSAIWDPWEALPGRREALARTDVYTLRRIVPADRGLPWDANDK